MRWRRSIDHLGEPLVSREELGESPLWPTAAILTAAGLYVTLPTKFVAGSTSAGIFGAARWVVATLVVLLLVLLVLTTPRLRLVQVATSQAAKLRVSRRIATIGVIALISAANATSIVLLVHFLVAGAQTNARLLLRAGLHQYRRLRVRYERRADIHEAFLQVAGCLICLKLLNAQDSFC